jgi:hypothetical protein
MLMVEPIKPFPVRRTATGEWPLAGEVLHRGRDDRWKSIGTW